MTSPGELRYLAESTGQVLIQIDAESGPIWIVRSRGWIEQATNRNFRIVQYGTKFKIEEVSCQK